MHGDRFALSGSFGLNARRGSSRGDQNTSLGTRLLHRRAYERVEQFLQDDLARDGLRHLDHGREVEVLNGRRNRACRCGRRLFGSEAWMDCVEVPHLAVRSPAEIAVASVSQIRARCKLETTGGIKACR